MRIIAYILSAILIFFGIAMSLMLPGTVEYAEIPAKPISAGILLLIWGVILQYSVRRNYRGGAPTYIGMVLFGLGIWHAVGIITWLRGVQVPVNVSAAVLLIVGGVALLISGHKRHVQRAENSH